MHASLAPALGLERYVAVMLMPMPIPMPPPLALADALELTRVVVACLLLLHSLEEFATRKALARHAALGSSTLLTARARGLSAWWLRVFDDRGMAIALAVRTLAAFALLVGNFAGAWGLALALNVLISMRWGGSFNGGSDSMMVVLLTGGLIASWAPGRAEFELAGVAYIAVQSLCSYLVSGITKVRCIQWRRGTALTWFTAHAGYRAPDMSQRLGRAPTLRRLVSWLTLALQCAAPWSLLDPRLTLLVLAILGLFHLANVRLFGLHRFLHLWLASYPCIYALSCWLARG